MPRRAVVGSIGISESALAGAVPQSVRGPRQLVPKPEKAGIPSERKKVLIVLVPPDLTEPAVATGVP